MSCKLLLDNWLLQDISQAIEHGLSKENTGKIKIDYKTNTHSFDTIPNAVIQIECLLNFLVDIITRDILIVDEAFSSVWNNNYLPIRKLQDEDILSLKKFNTKEHEFLNIRKFVSKDLCATESLEKEHKENEEAWDKYKMTAHKFLSQILWGTAGNMARGNIIGAPYSPHPSRKQLLEQTTFKPSRPDAIESTIELIDQTRNSLFENVRQGLKIRSTQIILPPLAIEVIENASDIEDLFTVALQIRDDYKKFRKYMSKLQEALDRENPKEMQEFKEVFDFVYSYAMKSNKSQEKNGDLSISLGVGFINYKKTFPLVDKVKSSFGIRATLQKMVFQKQGTTALHKLLKMFDENDTRLLENMKAYFQF